jgi:hypothetical protein
MVGHLAAAVQAVEVTVSVKGRPVRGVVSRSVFEMRFGASESPDSWLEAYRANAAAIDAAVCRKAGDNPQLAVVVLLESDFEARLPPLGEGPLGPVKKRSAA